MPNPFGLNYPGNQRPLRLAAGFGAPGASTVPASPRPGPYPGRGGIIEALGQTPDMSETDAANHVMRAMAAYSPMARAGQDQAIQAHAIAGLQAQHAARGQAAYDRISAPLAFQDEMTGRRPVDSVDELLAALGGQAPGRVHNGRAAAIGPGAAMVARPAPHFAAATSPAPATGITLPYKQAPTAPGATNLPYPQASAEPPIVTALLRHTADAGPLDRTGSPIAAAFERPGPAIAANGRPFPTFQGRPLPGAISTPLKADGTAMTDKEARARYAADAAAHPHQFTGRGNPVRPPRSILQALGQDKAPAAGFDQDALHRRAVAGLIARGEYARANDMIHSRQLQVAELANAQAGVEHLRSQTELANAQTGKSGAYTSPEQARNSVLLKTGDPALANEAAAQHRVDTAIAAAKGGAPLNLGPDDARRALETQYTNTIAPLFRLNADGKPAEGKLATIHEKLMSLGLPEVDDPNSQANGLIRALVPQMYGKSLATELKMPAEPPWSLSDVHAYGLREFDRPAAQLLNIFNSLSHGELTRRPMADWNRQQDLNNWWNSISRPTTR